MREIPKDIIYEVNKVVYNETNVEGLEEYKRITEHTGNRRGFIDRPLSYYQEMFNALGKNISIIFISCSGFGRCGAQK